MRSSSSTVMRHTVGMNADKWARASNLGRLVAHLASHVPHELAMLVLCHLARHVEPRPELETVIVDLERAALHEKPALPLEVAWSLGSHAEQVATLPSRVAADLATAASHPSRDPEHARRAAETIAELLAFELGASLDEASLVLADKLRDVVPYVTDQRCWKRVDANTWHTELLRCELDERGRLVRCR